MALTRNTLAARVRDGAGKGSARRLRAQGLVPAVVYGRHLETPVHIAVDPIEVKKAIATPHRLNTLLSLKLDGQPERLVLLKDYQQDPLSREMLHADFIDVRTLMTNLSIEELNRTSDEYFRHHTDLAVYLSKPFTQQQLATLLRRWLALRALPESERRDLSRVPLIDAVVLRNITALAKPALLNSMIDLYMQHSPGLIGAIETAAANMQADALSQAVHTLKSSTANLGGTRLATVAKECEVLVREGGITQAAPIVLRIRREYQEFCDALLRERSTNAA